MVNYLFCLAALVLFTAGFPLVKRGSPYTRGGGDNYTRRRMRRMLGWMMWTTAAVLLLLVLANVASTAPPDNVITDQSTARSAAANIPTVTSSARIIPNLLHAPALQADATSDSAFTNAASLADGSLTLASIQQHVQAMAPNLVKPLPDAPAVGPVVDKTSAGLATAPAAAPEAAAPSAPPVPGLAADASTPAQMNDVVASVSATLQRDPTNPTAYVQRGLAYSAQSQWDLAQSDFQHALRINSTSKPAIFGLAEVDFAQGHYEAAKRSFVGLEQDPDFGDLAKYKAFLCDLFGGHEDAAARELAVFNEVGSNASYYFANVAWSLYHKKSDEAKSWWDSANGIFAPDKINLYAKPLISRGYIKISS